MTFRRVALLGLLLAFSAPTSSSFAQEDLLAPLAPDSKDGSPAKKKKSRSTPADEGLLAPLAPTRLEVKLTAEISGAKLLIDGKPAGVLPAAPVALPPGTHRIEVQRKGFADFAQTVTVKEATTESLVVQLQPIAAVVNVVVDAPGAQVTVDDQLLGPAPLKDLLLEPGNHTVLVTREGFDDELNRIQVRAGKDYTVRVFMRPAALASTLASDRPERGADLTPDLRTSNTLPPEGPPAIASNKAWYQQWYVWAGAGAVVAAGIAGAVAVSQKDAGLPPGAMNAQSLARF